MEGIRMYKEKQKVGFGMNYTQSRELKDEQQDLSGDGEYLP